jgi:hypothetical protein
VRSLEASNVDFYLDQQVIDTTRPAGRMFVHERRQRWAGQGMRAAKTSAKGSTSWRGGET